MILIVTIKDDIHALRIQNVLAERGYKDCHILECDRISADHQLHFCLSRDSVDACIRLGDGTLIDINDIGLIWWRRVRADQRLDHMADEFEAKLINNDCRGAVNGIFDLFHGVWLSNPYATDRASNKIYQLFAAKACGFRVPETLVSQSRDEVESFCHRLDGRVIVKPVVGAAGPLLFTQFLNDPDRIDPGSYKVCPAVYQEYIRGTKHIRLNCFGENSYAAIIETSDLDWRPNLNVPIHSWDVPPSLHDKVRDVLDRLGLEMGIIDLKVMPDGEIVWLEVNPQGQFLFLEPLAKIPLSQYFADYLIQMSS